MLHQNARQSSRMPAADLREAHRTYLEETLFEAVVTAGVVVAFADGRADAAERLELVGFVEQSSWLSTFTPAETSDAFDSRVRQFEMIGGVSESTISSLRQVGDRAGILEVVCAAERVALADGRVQASEKTAIQFIRSAVMPV
jgi:tellurite resistance protein